MGKLLITGGAGYIGSQMVKHLVNKGREVIVYDNLSTGFAFLIHSEATFIEGDLSDRSKLDALFKNHSVEAVLHFAAFSQVGESNKDPIKYYKNNVSGALSLLEIMEKNGVKNLVFSSTAAVYGVPQYTPIDEEHPKRPINIYGKTKLAIELVLKDLVKILGFNVVSLRYFNAAGADSEGVLGECHDPESHLIPLVLQAASGRREAISIFGDQYNTADGTCVRDYIHVEDLCEAHALALHKIENSVEPSFRVYNLGSGDGHSVKEVIETAQSVVAGEGCKIKVIQTDPRVGDPPKLVADFKKAQQDLGWKPKYPDLESIVRHAWAWEKKLVKDAKSKAIR